MLPVLFIEPLTLGLQGQSSTPTPRVTHCHFIIMHPSSVIERKLMLLFSTKM